MFLCLMISGFVLGGCGNGEAPQVTEVMDSASSVSSGSDLADEDSGSGLSLYMIDYQQGTTRPVMVTPESDQTITAAALVEAVVEMFDEEYTELPGYTVETEADGSIRLDLHADDAAFPFGPNGGPFEEAALDCFCYSLFDNIKEAKNIYITVNGMPYSSNVLQFSADTPYMTNE